MTNQNHNNKSPIEHKDILGLNPDGLANLTVDEVVNNKTAVKMLFHYYKKLSDENMSLKNEKNTLNTYVDAYKRAKDNSIISSLLFMLSNLLIAFGVNLLTDKLNNDNAGWLLLISGIISTIAGIYFNFFKDKE